MYSTLKIVWYFVDPCFAKLGLICDGWHLLKFPEIPLNSYPFSCDCKNRYIFVILCSTASSCLTRKLRNSLSMLQFKLAFDIMFARINGPLSARTLRMSTYISSFDLLICCNQRSQVPQAVFPLENG
jgi:hypothetical protein